MSIPHAMLGLLNYKPSTGYDIRSAFEGSIQFFWNVSLPQIYRILNSMENKGWLSSSIEQQESKPNKKIYHVTKKGKQELHEWLTKRPEVPQVKDELLVKLFFGNQTDRSVIISHIQERRSQALQFLNNAQQNIEPSVEQYANKSGAAEDAPFWLLTLDFGRRRAQMTIEWCDATLKILEKNNGTKK